MIMNAIKKIFLMSGIAVLFMFQNNIFTSAEVTFFGDEVNDERDDHLAEQFQYGIQSSRVTSATTLTGSVSTATSMAVLSTGLGLGSTASIQSNRYIRYQPARQAYAIFSARFTTGIAGATQWMGCFDALDGFAVGYNGTTFSILYRNSVTGAVVNTTVAQASFNVDQLNGAGPSGLTLDPTKLNIFRIQYSWLGVTPIMFQIMNIGGTFVTFHMITQANVFNNPSLSIPQLPMRAEVANAGIASTVTLATAGWGAGIVDESRSPANGRTFIVTNTLPSLTTAAGEVGLLVIQNPTTFGGIANKIEAKICQIGGGGTDINGISIRMRLLRNATVTGTSFSSVSAGNSIMNVSTAGTYTVGTGTQVILFPNTTYGNSTSVTYFNTQDNVIDIVILPGETLTITAQALGSNTTAPIIGIIGWDERF